MRIAPGFKFGSEGKDSPIKALCHMLVSGGGLNVEDLRRILVALLQKTIDFLDGRWKLSSGF